MESYDYVKAHEYCMFNEDMLKMIVYAAAFIACESFRHLIQWNGSRKRNLQKKMKMVI